MYCDRNHHIDLQTQTLIIVVSSLKEIYRIKLPGSAKIGEGKPENQNHAIIFTRGEALQAIDMNQVSNRNLKSNKSTIDSLGQTVIVIQFLVGQLLGRSF